MSLHYHLATTKKGGSSFTEYFQQIKQIAAGGQPLNIFELTSYLIAGLGPEYGQFVTTVTTRLDPLPMDDLFNHLLAHDMRLEHHHQPSDPGFLATNIASCGRNHHYGREGGHGAFAHSSLSQHSQPWGRGYQTQAPNRGSSSPNGLEGQRPTCQVCSKLGHTALVCYRIFDRAYQTDGKNLTTYIAALSQSREPNQYLNTSATHHITSSLSNLNIHSEEYDGTDQIQVGNGTDLTIKHTNISKLPTSNFIYVIFCNHKRLYISLMYINEISCNQNFLDQYLYSIVCMYHLCDAFVNQGGGYFIPTKTACTKKVFKPIY